MLQILGDVPSHTPVVLRVRWKITGQGRIRNKSNEDGLVASVAAYYEGNIKIIHRYLSREVRELSFTTWEETQAAILFPQSLQRQYNTSIVQQEPTHWKARWKPQDGADTPTTTQQHARF